MKNQTNSLVEKKTRTLIETLHKAETLITAAEHVTWIDENREPIKSIISSTTSNIQKLKETRPDCKIDGKEYPSKFQLYIEDVKKIMDQYRKDKERTKESYPILYFENDVLECSKNLYRLVKDKDLLERIPNHRKSVEGVLKDLQIAKEKPRLFLKPESEKILFELRSKLDDFESELMKLSQDTHCWEECTWTKTITKYPIALDAEGGSGESRKLESQKTATHEKCMYCQKVRKTSPENLHFDV
jgi:hypothetical protein